MFCLLNEKIVVFRKLYSLERCILNEYKRKQTSFDVTLAIKPHFSQELTHILHRFNAAGLCVDGLRYAHARE